MTWHDARMILDLLVALVVMALVSIWAGKHVDRLIEFMTRSRPMSGKRYGKPQSTRFDEPYPFELMATLDDEDEVHAFVAVRQVDKLLGARFTSFSDEEAHKSVDLLVKLISKTLDDKDGTPATWAPVQLPLRSPGNAGDYEPPKFRGPDGDLYEMEHADKFAAFEAGSSRRRFLALVGDQERTVQAEDLTAIVKDLIAVSTGRPTGASVPSSA
jgi:hypothetical protein